MVSGRLPVHTAAGLTMSLHQLAMLRDGLGCSGAIWPNGAWPHAQLATGRFDAIMVQVADEQGPARLRGDQ